MTIYTNFGSRIVLEKQGYQQPSVKKFESKIVLEKQSRGLHDNYKF